MNKRLYLAALCLLTGLTAAAQQPIDSLQLLKDIRTLSDDKYEGRKTGTRGNRMAQFYILDRFKQAGLQPFHGSYEYPFYFMEGEKRIMGTNLYGYIKGKTDDVIVVTAHYDHLGTRGQAGADSIYNGADDNASGTAALLALVKHYRQHQPQHTLIFAALDGEEEGLQGAKAFVQQPPVPLDRIRLNINMDMVSRNEKQELYVCGTHPYPELKPYVTRAATGSRIQLLTGHDRPEDGSQNWTTQSDHYQFHKKGIPFLYFGVEDHADYHRVSDEFEHIDPAFYYAAVQRIQAVLDQLDKNYSGKRARSKVVY
ncbi:M20/M25/M40 family metallo-hydrolase [Chitinophaga japonensis]|uniref:Peptidase M28-like protein n=1 Tax=Chitinophaga japonensis TaxID=104662 RepID=A0A562TDZ8_CHIJA|nr:M20/M25/M40 family metallo-hydrolase [Chitinophaga japonensis]TWI91749.1 peptidase M28-like protein [Chitinophaga japonensis]